MTAAFTIRQGDIADLDAICDLEAACFPFHPWSRGSWFEEMTLPGHTVFVATTESGLTGGAIAIAATDDTADLLRVMVAPVVRRQRVAAALVGAGVAHAKRTGVERCLLEVEAGNDAALTLYGKAGFHEISRRADYYGPGHDAIVMQMMMEDVSLAEPAKEDPHE